MAAVRLKARYEQILGVLSSPYTATSTSATSFGWFAEFLENVHCSRRICSKQFLTFKTRHMCSTTVMWTCLHPTYHSIQCEKKKASMGKKFSNRAHTCANPLASVPRAITTPDPWKLGTIMLSVNVHRTNAARPPPPIATTLTVSKPVTILSAHASKEVRFYMP
jgi:hypothetical protein